MPPRTGKIARNGNCLTVVIPRDYLHLLGWHHGDEITIHVEKGLLVVAPLRAAVEANDRLVAELFAGHGEPR